MLKSISRKISRNIINYANLSGLRSSHNDEQVAQKNLMQQFRLLAAQDKTSLPDFADIGFRKYSQFEEDGILLYIFSLVKPINRHSVEICAADGRQCNTTNLILNHGWWGFLFDGDEENVRQGEKFFADHEDTFLYPPRFNQAWITAENVNEVISNAGVQGPIDLLSLDLDGVDYWVWKAIDVIDPQVVVCETHNPVPPDRALTVPYDPNFVFESENFRGASLLAMCRLASEKGCRLIGSHRYGFNSFFMKNGVGEEFFPEVTPQSCVADPFSQLSRETRWPDAQKHPWHEVGPASY